jgi:four helix bundle protein
MKPAETFTDLVVWQKSHRFVLDVYRVSTRFPSHELYGLTSQLRRAAVSVPANIAEGFRKRGKGDKLRYFNIAQGSLEEARYYLLPARDLGYVETTESVDGEEVSRLLQSYCARVRQSNQALSSHSVF